MTPSEHDPSLRSAILADIQSGKAKMRGRSYFVVHAALLGLGVIVLVLGLLYAVSLAIFMLKQTGAWFAPTIGWRGLLVFLAAVPWLLVVVTLIFVLLLEGLLQSYRFAYRRPILYSLLAILAVTVFGGFGLAHTRLHLALYNRAFNHGFMPLAGNVYRGCCDERPSALLPGKVTAERQTGFLLMTPEGRLVEVVVTSTTRLPRGTVLTVGDSVIVIGSAWEAGVLADGVRLMEPVGHGSTDR